MSDLPAMVSSMTLHPPPPGQPDETQVALLSVTSAVAASQCAIFSR
ncbi:hypothetical protein [Mycobacterium avium]|nr:hypothetical protein [Mycobacterium avium]